MEKKLEKQGSMCIGFVDLEKVFDTMSRKMVMATLRWLGVPEAEIRMVEATYEQTSGRVIIGAAMSEQFSVNIGLRQGSALSPLLFIVVIELISRKVSMKNASRKLLYADDLAIVAEDKEELNESLEEWKEAFKQHGLRVNLEKTDVLSIGAHREELNIKLEGRTIRQNNSFIYLSGAVSSDGRSETEVRRRVQAGANAWRQVEGVMSDRHISKKLKGKVLGACVTPAMLYGLETLPLTEKHQHRLKVCENNWVRRIAGVKRVDRRRMDELREEVGIQKCLMGRLVKSRMKWAGHVERMKEDRLPRMAYVHQERGKGKRGRPRMRWRDCIERDTRNAELEDVDWRMLAQDRGQWRMVVHRAAETCSHPYP